MSSLPYTRVTMSTKAVCARCGDFVGADAAYSDEGDVVCASCEARGELSAGADRAAAGLVSMALGALALASISVVFNPFFLASIGTGASTLTWLTTARLYPDYTSKLGRRKYLCWAALAVACVIASYDVLRLFLVMLIIAWR